MNEPTAAAGGRIAETLRATASLHLGEQAAQAGLLGAWRSTDWLTLRVLGDFDAATDRELEAALAGFEALYDSEDRVRAALARHTREVLHLWPRRSTIDTTCTVARRSGLVSCDWRARPRRRWALTAAGREVFAELEDLGQE